MTLMKLELTIVGSGDVADVTLLMSMFIISGDVTLDGGARADSFLSETLRWCPDGVSFDDELFLFS